MAFRVFERLFVIAFLLLSMQVDIGLMRPYEADIDPAGPSTSVHFLNVATEMGVAACGFVLVLLRWRRVFHAALVVWPLLVISLLAALSAAWSDVPMLTLRRSALLLLSTVLAIYLGERYTVRNQVHLLTSVFCLMISAILILYFVAPAYVIDSVSHPGAWKGLSAYKNAFGQYMGTGVIILLLARFRHFRGLRWAFLVLAAVLLLLSKSAASLFCCVLIVAVMPLWRSAHATSKQRPALYTVVGLALLSGMYLLATNTQRVLDLLGRDATLSGRTHLWAMVWVAIMKHPLLGYGFETFWASSKGEALDVRVAAGWLAERADNGFLELGLGLGALGVALFLFVLALFFWRGIEYLRSEQQPWGLWPVSYLCFFLLHNMSESTLLTRGDFPSVVFAMVFTTLALNRGRATVGNLSRDIDNEVTLLPHATPA